MERARNEKRSLDKSRLTLIMVACRFSVLDDERSLAFRRAFVRPRSMKTADLRLTYRGNWRYEKNSDH